MRASRKSGPVRHHQSPLEQTDERRVSKDDVIADGDTQQPATLHHLNRGIKKGAGGEDVPALCGFPASVTLGECKTKCELRQHFGCNVELVPAAGLLECRLS